MRPENFASNIARKDRNEDKTPSQNLGKRHYPELCINVPGNVPHGRTGHTGERDTRIS
jgi:hypothetical protein